MNRNFQLFFWLLSIWLCQIWSFWPLRESEIVLTKAMIYDNSFVILEKKKNLLFAKPQSEGFSLTKIFQYAEPPDLVRHFPVENGHLVAALFNAEKKLSLLAFGNDGNIYFRKNIRLKNFVKDFDLRINENGEPICLFYIFTEKEQMHLLQLYDGKSYKDLVLSESPFDDIFLQLAVNGVHAITRIDGQVAWVSSVRDVLQIYYLPFYITNSVLFLWKGKVYLLGMDTRNHLYRFYLSKEGLKAEIVFSSTDLLFVKKIIPFTYRNKLNLFLFAPGKQRLIRLDIADFETLKDIKDSSRPLVAEWEKIQPLLLENELHFLIESSLSHVYNENFFKKPLFYEVNFRVEQNKNPPRLAIFWKSEKDYLSYRYFLNKNMEFEPLDEEKIIKKRQIIFENLEEGDYILHIQGKDLKTQERTHLYHIPIQWRYRPDEPEVLLLNEIAPSLVSSGKLELFVTNPFPGEYFYEISINPKANPRKSISFTKEGRMVLPTELNPGSYYLHLCVRDPRSGEFSSVLHKLFFVDTYSPFRDPSLSKAKRELEDLEILLEEIRKNRNNPSLLKQKVKELEKKSFP